jgi:FkbM family methyltransferase
MMAGPSVDVRSVLRHPDPPQLLYQLREIVDERVYLQRGVRVGEGDVVFDVGANVGVAAAFFAANCGATVHSFEPVKPIYDILRENLRPFPNCIAHNVGLSSSSGRATITYYPNADAMSGLYADPEIDRLFTLECFHNVGMTADEAQRALVGRFDDSVVLDCELRTLSSVLRDHAVDRVHLLKIDVERAELDVLNGIDDNDWPRIDQIVAEVHNDDGRLASISALLAAWDFSLATEQEAAMRGTGVHLVYAIRPWLVEVGSSA